MSDKKRKHQIEGLVTKMQMFHFKTTPLFHFDP